MNSNLFMFKHIIPLMLISVLNSCSSSTSDITGEANRNKVHQGNQLDISIESFSNEYIKGQLIDLLVRVKNNTEDTIEYDHQKAVRNLYSYEESRTIEGRTLHSPRLIPPGKEYIFLENPLEWINHKGKETHIRLSGLPWYYWLEGDYDYYITYKLNGELIESNKIPLKIKPVPDSLAGAFEDLKSHYPFTENWWELYNKYKGTFFDKEYFYRLLLTKYSLISAIKKGEETTVNLFKEFILKYPNTEAASRFLQEIYFGRKYNENLENEIFENLKQRDDTDIIKSVVENSKMYWNANF